MPLITWSDAAYSVKNSTIDSQHKRLIEMINELNEAMASRNGFDVTDRVIEKTLEYTFYHFQNEEALMDKFSYPEMAHHITQHETFRKKIATLKKQAGEHVGTVPRELLLYLRDWLLNHIIHVDKKLGAFLQEQGQE
jgi:hemerythrin-like metal-binding protein